MELFEAIKRRRSVRQYPRGTVSEEKFGKLKECLGETRALEDGEKTDALLVENGSDFQGSISGVIADYGKVEAPHYLVLTAGRNKGGFIEIGYRYEFVVLELTAMNIGTCWIGKGFSDESLEQYVNIPPGQTCSALIAFGPLEGEAPDLIEEPKRKDPETFLLEDSIKEVDQEALELLDALRRAPSSLNSQPWRVLVEAGTLHLYIKSRTFITKNLLGGLTDMNRVDAGIGLCHLKVAGEHLFGNVEVDKRRHPSRSGLEYIASLET